MSLGENIKNARIKKGLSQQKLAELISDEKITFGNTAISNWENGINRPDADILANICRVLEVSPSELLDVKLSTDELTDKERKVIQAYRLKTDLQHSVNILLGLDEET